MSVSCLTNTYYHAGREAFLDTVHRWFMFGVVLLGAAAVFDLFPVAEKELVKGLCAAGAAVFGALDLTFDLSNRARTHSMLRRRYYDLLADMKEGSRTPESVKAAIDRLSGDEEPMYRVMQLASWNAAQETIHGRRAKTFSISPWGLATKNIFRHPGVSYPVKEPALI